MKVAMLVNNPCVIDTRVIKQARALVDFGHSVTVLCLDDGTAPKYEVLDGVTYVRFLKWKSIPSYLKDSSLDIENKIIQKQAQSLNANTSIQTTSISPDSFSLKIYNKLKNIVYFAINIPRNIIRRNIRKIIRLIVTPSVIEYLKYYKMYAHYLKLERFDVIHAHDLYTLPASITAAIGSKAIVIYDSHELEMHRNATYTIWEKFLRRKIETYYINRVKEVITVCDSIADFLETDYKIKKPHVILNGPDIGRDEPVESNVRKCCGLSDETPLGVYIGAVTINRGLEYCVRALAYAPEMHMATVGPIRAQTKNYILREAETAGVIERLHIIEPVKPEQVTSFVKTADFSIVPIQNVCLSYYFCFPNKLFESALSGLPIIGARLVEIEKFLKNTNTGLLMDETDPQDIARAMQEIYKNRLSYVPSQDKKLEILNTYGWEVQKIKLKKIYNDIQSA